MGDFARLGRRFSLAFAAARSMNGPAMGNHQTRDFRKATSAAGRSPAKSIVVAVTGVLAVLLIGLSPVVSFANEAQHVADQHAAVEHPPAGHGDGHGDAAHGPPEIDAKTLGLQVLNFAVLLFILVKFGGGAINKALAARHQQLKTDLAAAAELRAAAEAKLVKQEARLASLENEIAGMRRGIKAEADAEKARLIAAAEERAQRIKTETTFLVDQQVREAETRLRRESAVVALKAAEDILRRAIGGADQQRLLDTFINDVEQPVAPSAGRPA